MRFKNGLDNPVISRRSYEYIYKERGVAMKQINIRIHKPDKTNVQAIKQIITDAYIAQATLLLNNSSLTINDKHNVVNQVTSHYAE